MWSLLQTSTAAEVVAVAAGAQSDAEMMECIHLVLGLAGVPIHAELMQFMHVHWDPVIC